MKLMLGLAPLFTVALFAQSVGGETAILTPDQTIAVSQMSDALKAPQDSVTSAREALTESTLTQPAAIDANVKAVESSELSLAAARSHEFEKLQTSRARLTPDQVAALIARSSLIRATANHTGTIPGITAAQVTALTKFSTNLLPLTGPLNAARAALTKAAFVHPPDETEIHREAEAVRGAELRLAEGRAESFAKIQASSEKLAPAQISAFLQMGGSFAGVSFTQPDPLNFRDHAGYTSLFDGVSLRNLLKKDPFSARRPPRTLLNCFNSMSFKRSDW